MSIVYILDIVSLPFAPELRQILSNRQKSLKKGGYKSQNHGVSYLDIDKVYDKILFLFSVSLAYVGLVTPAVLIKL